ncbi:hypothetical protein SLEP1_g26850 [Rubroshorea leprosula]|uniref:Uncharacterized protein n=1 Tax=Rubroshorea leprosula TaxID=152421 RepID=A0AAV5JUI2_9ROSI|nr:hypothetical protein SLEP1_g26850 [Rubroshorea leprosula]
MRSLLDPIIEKMKNLSKALEMHLHNEAAKGQLKAKLVVIDAYWPWPINTSKTLESI